MLSLAIENRDMKVKSEAVRKSGLIPAIFYGPKEKSTPITVNAKDFKKVWKQAGESSIIILKDAKGSEHEALIYDTDIHPLSGDVLHADFYVVEKGKKIQVSVPLVYEGVSPAVKDKGAILVKVMRELKIEAAPRDLPHEIKIDISKLVEFSDVVKVKDISLPSGVDLKSHEDDVVASVYEPKEEVEAPTTIDMSSIEVEAKGKEAKEGEAPAEEAKKEEKK